MKRTSKYLGNIYNGWKVVHIGVATVQSKKLLNGKGKAKRPGHCNYYYLLERETSDNKAIKQIRLNSQNMCSLARGTFDIEDYADTQTSKKSKNPLKQTSYRNI